MKPVPHRLCITILAAVLTWQAQAQTLENLGATAPTPGLDDISQLSTSGNTAWPDGLNYFTDNNPPVGQTFTTGASAKNLVSVALKTAGINSGNGYGIPAGTPTYYLHIHSMSGSTATPLITLGAPNPGFTDGDWLRWSGLNVHLEANKTYAFSFGTQPSGGGWAAMAVATNALAGGEIALIPIDGGAITTGGSHSYDAVFSLGLETPAILPDTTPLPTPTYGWNLGNTLEATWGYQFPNQKPFYSAANAGFNAVRVPCAWNFNADPVTYQIDPAYMAQVKQVVDWSIAAGMHVVINVHWDGGWMENNIGDAVDPVIDAKLSSYWTQIATTFAGYDNRLLFAAANEPNVHSPAEFGTLMDYYQTFISAVRGVGGGNTNRWLVLQGGGDTSWFTNLPPDPTPGRLMVEYHNYTPSLFTIIHTDQTWGNTIHCWGAAYHNPANPARNGTWPAEGQTDSGFQQLKEQYVDKGIPVLVGEFQAAGKSYLTGMEADYNRASTLYWNKYLVDSAHAHGLSPFYWSTPDSPFNHLTGAITDPEVVEVITGGVAPPPPNGAPYAVTGLVATAGAGQVSLSWNPAAGATSYNIHRTAQSGYEPAVPSVTGVTGTSYVDPGLNDGTTYYYQVVAVNASGPSGFSAEAHATTPGINPDPAQFHFETDTHRWSAGGAQIPGIATSSSHHFAGSRSLAVSFNGTAGGTSSVSVSDVVVDPGTTITFRVWIPAGSEVTSVEPYLNDYNWTWASSWYGNLTADAWNTITLTVPSGHDSPLKQLGLRFNSGAAWTGTCHVDSVAWPVVEMPPAAPTGLVASAGSGKVTLNWAASATAANYHVKRTTTSGSGYTTVATTAGLGYTDTGLVDGTTYHYVVSAFNSAGESPGSAEAGATPTVHRALYAFEGDAQDASGNGFHGTSAALTYVAGRIGAQAAQFDGSNSSATIPRSITDDFTVTLWVKTTDTAGAAGAQWWSGKGLVDGEVGGGGADWGTSIVNGKFVLGVGSTGGDTSIASSVNINDGAWHHLAATRNNTTGAMEVHVDGVLRGSGTGPTGARDWPAVLRIGGLQPGYNFLAGTLDDVRLFDRVLGNAEIQSLAAGQLPAPQNPTATGGSGRIDLAWTAVPGADSYLIHRSGSMAGPFSELVSGLTGTSHADSGLGDGATWYYTVTATGLPGLGVATAPFVSTTRTAVEVWRLAHFGTSGDAGIAADSADPDGDDWTNADEYISGTDPNNRASVLRITSLIPTGGDTQVSIPTVAGRTYRIERSGTLLEGSWLIVQEDIAGTGGLIRITDPGGTGHDRRFYRAVVTYP